MAVSSEIISLRLPKQMRNRLDQATLHTRRSRSYLMQRALEKYLDAIEREDALKNEQGPLETLLSLKGSGIGSSGPRTKDEIDGHIRWLRDNG